MAKNDAVTSDDARARTATALDTAAAATARAQAAEGALAAARAACVCGACAGVMSGGGVEAEPVAAPAAPSAHGRALVFDPHAGSGGAYVFAGSGKSVASKSAVDENSEATTAAAPRPPRPDLPTLVADVEAALARRGW